MTEDREPSEHEPQMPSLLRQELRALYGWDLPMPGGRDEAILAAARQHFVRQRRSRMLHRWLPVGAGAAAAAAIALIVWTSAPLTEPSAESPAAMATALPGDIDGNGRVDILDAFLLARSIEAGADHVPGGDINGDGVIDHHDVDAIALTAVRLDGGAS
jgi:hypothetical protein